MNDVSLDQLSAARFAELLRTTFHVLVKPDHVVPLELTAVTATSPGEREDRPSPNEDFERFSLLFNGPVDQPLGQRTYRFAHERLGWFDLFIVPVGADRGARQYEAVFNRRSSAPAAPPATG